MNIIWNQGSIAAEQLYVGYNTSRGPEGIDCIQVWPPKWEPNHAYTLGDQVIPTQRLLELYFEAQNAGTSGLRETGQPDGAGVFLLDQSADEPSEVIVIGRR